MGVVKIDIARPETIRSTMHEQLSSYSIRCLCCDNLENGQKILLKMAGIFIFNDPIYLAIQGLFRGTIVGIYSRGIRTMGCCDDPTEPVKINRTDVARVQEQYGNLVRALFTSDPEKVMLKQLKEANVYLRELAALTAFSRLNGLFFEKQNHKELKM